MTRPEIAPLTGLRAAAALWVLLYHLRLAVSRTFPDAGYDLGRDGYLGVDVFFVLSGFILSLNYTDRIRSRSDYVAFLGYRLARLYPLHLFTLVALLGLAHGAMALGLHVNHPERYPLDRHLLANLLLLHAWGFEDILRYNLPSWSISAELFAYLLFPAFAWLAGRARRPWVLAILAGAASLGTVVILRTVLGHDDLHVVRDHALVRVSGEFLAGCLVYRVYASRAGQPPMSPAVGVLLLGAVVAVALSPVADWGMPAAACVLVYVLARGRGAAVSLFAAAPVVWLGRISYSIYLVHLPVFSGLNRLAPAVAELGGAPRLLYIAGHVALALLVATLCYHAVERPGRRRIRAWVDGATSRTPREGRRPSAPPRRI